jgi:phosphoribosylglycinamide formyltransferase 2
MLDGARLRAAVEKHRPDFVVPEIEAIRTEELEALEREGWRVVPSARAAAMTMNRDAIRSLAAETLGLRTSRYRFATSLDEVRAAAEHTGLPCVVKPVMSHPVRVSPLSARPTNWSRPGTHAVANMRGDRPRVIVEEFIAFDYEITLLTVRTRRRRDLLPAGRAMCRSRAIIARAGSRRRCRRRPSRRARRWRAWSSRILAARPVRRRILHRGDEAIFSELSPRPHDTGMVTLISQELSEFDLHVRAILGLPVPDVGFRGPSASAVILATARRSGSASRALADALAQGAPRRRWTCGCSASR